MNICGVFLENSISGNQKLLDHLRSERTRWMKIFGADDKYDSDTTIGFGDVLSAHFNLLEFFAESREGVGGIGPKDLGLLESALGRQFVEYGGKPKWNNRLHIVATLVFGLIKNHPFHDANKRTAFLTSILHLQKIGRTPTVDGQIYEDFMVDIAEDDLSKYGNFIKPDQDSAVNIIADFLRKNTRDIDLRVKQITYNKLSAILSGYGLRFENPRGNRIDLIRFKDPELALDIKPTRIAHIGFHGWTKEVSPKDIHIIRNAAKLDAQHGYDSQSFFNGFETPLSLINKYKEPLRRLAFR